MDQHVVDDPRRHRLQPRRMVRSPGLLEPPRELWLLTNPTDVGIAIPPK